LWETTSTAQVRVSVARVRGDMAPGLPSWFLERALTVNLEVPMSVMSSEKKEMIFRELTWFCLGTTGRRCRARRQDCSPRFARRLAAIAQGTAGDVNRSTERVVLHMGNTLNGDESRFLLARILVAPCRWMSTAGRFSRMSDCYCQSLRTGCCLQRATLC
jgi:hypothetical protein